MGFGAEERETRTENASDAPWMMGQVTDTSEEAHRPTAVEVREQGKAAPTAPHGCQLHLRAKAHDRADKTQTNISVHLASYKR